MSKDERAAKVAEITREMSWPSTVRRDAENIRALLAIVAELERLNAGIDRYDPYKRPECGCPHISACANVACPRRLGDAT